MATEDRPPQDIEELAAELEMERVPRCAPVLWLPDFKMAVFLSGPDGGRGYRNDRLKSFVTSLK